MMAMQPPAAPPTPTAASSDYTVEQRGGRYVVLDAGAPLIDFGSDMEAQAALAALKADHGEDASEGGDEAASPAAPPPSWQSRLMSGMAQRGRKG